MEDVKFWKNKRVFLTGYTGFKGSWLSLWLHSLGANVTGYALEPETDTSLFYLCKLDELITSHIGDVRDEDKLREVLINANPEIVIHMAAQPLVRESYFHPVETYQTNVIGTVNVLEAVRCAVDKGVGIKAVINVTTDKCYQNNNWVWSYREQDPLGGYDPYSNSKACSELVTSSYRNSFFNPKNFDAHGVSIATVRAGNVIGGGDWSLHRLIPDCIKALLNKDVIEIRNPNATRPWQHVLEPLSGYLMLAQKLYENGPDYGCAWNFGPDDVDAMPVEWIVQKLCALWGGNASFKVVGSSYLHEDHFLKLDNSKARMELGWSPRWNIQERLEKVVEWTKAYEDQKDIGEVCLNQLVEFNNKSKKKYHD
ncbi:CDP-glucose 4,6-dehydratase [Bacillus thuringiensis]